MKKKVYSASVTPLLDDGSLDRAGLQRLLERNLGHGVDGFFVLGSMGEWGSFSTAFKAEYVATCAECLRRRADLLVGINATSLPLSLELMQEYAALPFSAYVFMLPGRTSALSPLRSVLQVLDRADRLVYYYHCPPNNGIDFTLEQFAEIMAHPNLRGIKNSASNMVLRRELLLLRRERGFQTELLEGQEWAVDEALYAGMDGMLCGMGALAGKVMVSLARAAEREDYAAARRHQETLIEIFHGVYGRRLETVWAGQKYALHCLGILSSPCTLAQEMSCLDERRRAEIRACLRRQEKELD